MNSKRKAIRRRRQSSDRVDAGLRRAIELHAAGNAAAAQTLCEQVLERQPDSPLAMHLLGRIAYDQQRPTTAIEWLQRAVELQPDSLPAQIDLANILAESNRREQAAAVLLAVLRQQPDHALALNNWGVVLKDLERIEESIAALQRAIELDPQYVDAHKNLCYAYMKQQDWSAATEAMESACALVPQSLEPIRVLGRLYRMQQRTADAVKIYERWAELTPDDPVPQYMLRALRGDQDLERAPADYITAEFDSFAESFEQELTKLEYRAPELLAAEFQSRFRQPSATRSIADLGCGTGWAGPYFRPYARTLTGVDLSAKMLEKAAARESYDELVCGELGEFLAARTASFDWIISVDTLNYIGNLSSTFCQAFAALRPAGVFAFTLESATSETQSGYRLTESGRYSHAIEPILNQLAEIGFCNPAVKSVPLRNEANTPVPGHIVWVEKPAAV